MKRNKKPTVWGVVIHTLFAFSIGACIATPTTLTKLFLGLMCLIAFARLCYLEGSNSNYNH